MRRSGRRAKKGRVRYECVREYLCAEKERRERREREREWVCGVIWALKMDVDVWVLLSLAFV